MFIVYDATVGDGTAANEMNHITNCIFKLLPIREEGGDWIKPLESLVVELSGLSRFVKSDEVFSLLCKLQGILEFREEMEFMLFRRTVFECCSMAKAIEKKLRSGD